MSNSFNKCKRLNIANRSTQFCYYNIDLTWDDQEEDGLSYEYFNIGLDRMEKENKELAGLMAEFGGKIRSLSDRTELNQKDLDAIRDLMEGISRNVGKISDTVSTLSGED